MGLKWYGCSLCGAAITKDSQPYSNGCSNRAANGGNHRWHTLGDVGSINYQCSLCGLTIQTSSVPSSDGCPNKAPNGGNHRWHRL